MGILFCFRILPTRDSIRTKLWWQAMLLQESTTRRVLQVLFLPSVGANLKTLVPFPKGGSQYGNIHGGEGPSGPNLVTYFAVPERLPRWYHSFYIMRLQYYQFYLWNSSSKSASRIEELHIIGLLRSIKCTVCPVNGK
jgi:hypothetical protein